MIIDVSDVQESQKSAVEELSKRLYGDNGTDSSADDEGTHHASKSAAALAASTGAAACDEEGQD